MNVKVKRKRIVFAVLVFSLVCAMFVNWYYTKPANSESVEKETATQSQRNLGDAQFVSAEPDSDFFANAILNRSKSQDEEKQMLTEILENSEVDAESRKSAREALERLADRITLQTDMENLISAKSGGNVLVCLSDTAEVVLQNGTMSDELCLRIKDIITNKTEISSEKITIIEAK
ncbi:MAG: SpoIIIAH-like family protein [Ruminococcaceae bacterium]|nr:SpoIIIAH-like family protein [Oscillospiraceae bacterium]